MPTLHWIGKEKVINHHQDVPYRVLQPQYTYNNGQQTTDATSQNKIIQGDNLEALKSLLPEYEGKIKCIYIDPPYNTGNEGWVYNDNVNDPKIKKWLGDVVGKESEDLSRHDKWLCMMYPRLKLLHRLLVDDGAIFISMDENEITNLRQLCAEIFGESNYIATITTVVKPEGRRYGFFAKTHEYILVFAKKASKLEFNEINIEGKGYQYEDRLGGFNLKGLRNRNVKSFNSNNRPNLRYPFYVNMASSDKNGFLEVSVDKYEGWKEVYASTVDGLESVWRWGKEKALKQNEDLVGKLGKDNEIRIFQKERKLTQIAKTTWNDKNFHSITGTRELTNILGKSVFDFPKPEKLIRQIIEIGVNDNDIILDSFAGSGTTAHAVLNLNKQDGGNRKFILVEMEDYADSVTAERVKRVIKGYGKDKKAVEGTGGNFTYYTLGEPMFLEDEMLNESLGEEAIRQYVWYTETHVPYVKPAQAYLMGTHQDTAYYFYYEVARATTLNEDFLKTLQVSASQYIIYADICLLDPDMMKQYNIIFKKIPRDITRF